MKLPITQFSLVTCYFLPLRSQYIHQHPQPIEMTIFKFMSAMTITLTQTLTLTCKVCTVHSQQTTAVCLVGL
jgi:hypothetical protein